MTQASRPFEIHEPEPTGFARIVAIIGEKAGDELMAALGGRRVYVPQDPGEHHPLSAAVGHANARALANAYGREFIDIPLSPALRDRILRLADAGLGPAKIRSQLGCSRRWVFQVLADRDQQDRQPDLF